MEDKRLDLLLTYTTFHIGLYLTLTTAFMGASTLGKPNHWLIRCAVGCFLLSGACGGIIAENIAENGDSASIFFSANYKFSL
jgi:hypothetical protein